MSEIHDAVRAWAKGIHPSEAAVELLIHHGKAIYDGAPWLSELYPSGAEMPRMVAVDVDALVYEAGAWSGSERRVVAIAASLLSTEHPVTLEDAVTGLDRQNLTLVLAAIAHANGSHQHSDMIYSEDGRPVGFERLSSLYPWPGEEPPRGPGANPQPPNVSFGGPPPATDVGPGL